VKKPHFYTSLSILGLVLLAVLFLPLPCSIICTLEIQPRDAQPVYVDVPGKLITLDVTPGQHVEAGQQLATLRSIDTDLQLAKIEGQLNEYRTKGETLLQQSFHDHRAASQLPQVQEMLATLEDQLKQKKRDQQRLRLTAPIAGMVLPPELTQHHEEDEKLPKWSGMPFDRENLGAVFEQGMLFCQVGNPKQLQAVLAVDQADRNLIREGQEVDIRLEGLPFTTFHGKIVAIAESELKVSPHRLSTKSGGELPTKTDPHTGVEKPISTTYQANVPLDDPEGVVRLGLRGQARVYTEWVPLGTRFWRLIMHTFNFKL
jgi:putative peptide zinc metalloprotease protein